MSSSGDPKLPQAWIPRRCFEIRCHELQYRNREAFLGQTLFDVVLFNVAEPRFEQALISFDIQFMIPQTGNSVGHSRHPALKCFFKKSRYFYTAII